MSEAPRPPSLSGLSPEVRSLISLALFIHLFAVGLGLSANVASVLQGQLLGNVFGWYLYPLNLAVDYSTNYQLTHATALDVDHILEIDTVDADGATHTLRLPDGGWRGGEPFRRRQKLADVAAEWLTREDQQEYKGLIPQALAGHAMHQWQTDSAQIRIRAHALQSAAQAASSEATVANPDHPDYFRLLYDAKATLFAGQIGLLERTEALETAPSASGQTNENSGR